MLLSVTHTSENDETGNTNNEKVKKQQHIDVSERHRHVTAATQTRKESTTPLDKHWQQMQHKM